MPESVTDRPTKSHETIFLFSKQPRYFFDQEAVREKYQDPREGGDGFRWHSERYTNQTPAQSNHTPTAKGPDGRKVTKVVGADGSIQHRDGERWPNGGRNIRSVWEIATQPYPDAHFATFPEALPERCIKAGCPERVCLSCGKASERETKVTYDRRNGAHGTVGRNNATGSNNFDGAGMPRLDKTVETTGWSDCGHDNWRTGVVLDPFMGSGTTALVARRLGRKSVGVELNPEYAQLCARRLQQLSLLAEPYTPQPVVPRGRSPLTGGAYSPPGQSPHSNARGKDAA